MFRTARPVWPEGLEKEKNIHVGFRTVFSGGGATQVSLRLTGATIYRVFLNGKFIQHGPARGPHGFYRVDELDLSKQTDEGDNLLAIEVIGYNCNSFAYLNQPSFLQAELTVNDTLTATTGGKGFEAVLLPDRIQKVERYSFQRPFMEAYALGPSWDKWRKNPERQFHSIQSVVSETRNLLPRGVDCSDFNTLEAAEIVATGSIAYEEKPVDRSGYWWMTDPRYQTLESFQPEEFDRDLLQTWQACDGAGGKDGRWEIRDLGSNRTGFIRLSVVCKQPVRLIASFDELLIDGDIDLLRNSSLNFVYYELQPGTYDLESVEPYVFRYLKILILDGEAEIQNVGIREYANPGAVCRFECADTELQALFKAGHQTFRQNAVDIYMDCPGRERAGWLCDSFFTARAEALLCGNSKVERNFLENYLLPESFRDIPPGMLPMCYPAEHPGGRHIPQWCMWLILQLEEYLERTGDRDLIDRFFPKVTGILGYFRKFENSYGLLESLPSWNFIEWSMANKLTEGVNYPSNMLYARMLESAARLYEHGNLLEKASAIHSQVHEQSFDGTFFVDNAVRDESGVLKPSGERTEVCQYYAFFCGTATMQHHATLWNYLLEQAGPGRTNDCPLHPANVFIGSYLRMELLSRQGESAQLLREIKNYFSPMVDATGTLWEFFDKRASCNHGFASCLCVLLARHVVGAVPANGLP